MIEKVTVHLTEESKFEPGAGRTCNAMNPKELLLYAAAQCAGQTLMMILQKGHVVPKRLEIAYSGELSTPTLEAASRFVSFHVSYNIACGAEDDQVKVSRAVRLAHERYCGLTQMLRMIAPVTHEVAVVSTQPVEA